VEEAGGVRCEEVSGELSLTPKGSEPSAQGNALGMERALLAA